jgi:hypothetical protein
VTLVVVTVLATVLAVTMLEVTGGTGSGDSVGDSGW